MVKSRKRKNSSRRIALLGIFTAILLVQNFVPFLGNIPIPPLNPTIIHLTVLVATLTLGTVDGMIVGGTWGVIRLVRALAMPATPLDPILWVNPVITIVPRILIGLFAGGLYQFLKKNFPKNDRLNMTVSSVIGSLTNTVFVLLFIYLFYGEDMLAILDVDVSNLGTVLMGIIGIAAVPEAILAGLVVPLLVRPLKKIYAR